jgi:hypothetical protein
MVPDINKYLNKDEYEKKRTPSELNKWVQEISSLIGKMKKNERYKLLEGKLGKKFDSELIPLNLFVQHDFRNRNDIRVEPLSGNESVDARIYQKEGKELLYEVQITESVDEEQWPLRKRMRRDESFYTVTSKIKEVKTLKGRILMDTDETITKVEHVENILQRLDKKFDKMTACDTQTLLLLYFDDYIAFRPDDERTEEERVSLATEISKRIHSKEPNIDKLVLVGWTGKSFYEFPINKKP